MILVYDKKESNFSRNGLAVLQECESCTIMEKLNGLYELNLAYPLHLKKAAYLQPFNIIKAEGQLFRLYHVEKDSRRNLLYAKGRHIFYDLAHFFIEDKRAVDKTCLEVMNMVLQETGLSGLYQIDSDISDKQTQYVIQKNGAEAFFLIVNRWRGELYRDNFSITIKKPQPNNKGVTVQYGKNVLGITEKISADEVVTALYPVGARGLTLPEKYVTAALIGNTTLSGGTASSETNTPSGGTMPSDSTTSNDTTMSSGSTTTGQTAITNDTTTPSYSTTSMNPDDYPSFPLIKKVEFLDAEDEETLRQEALDYLAKHSTFSVNYQIDFIQLAQTAEYENYQSLLQVKVGDTVTVKHKLLGLDFTIKVIALEKDLLSAQNSKVELGEPLYTLDQYIEEFKENVHHSFEKVDYSFERVDHSFEAVNHSVGGIQEQIEQLGKSSTIVKSLTMDSHFFYVTYAVEKGDVRQFSAKYSYSTDGSGQITSITLDEIFTEFLLKEVSTLLVETETFEVTYVDGTMATYNYSTDSTGRITGIEKVEGETP
ncbi:phage tail spike protein [Heliorestis convoluta]|uniref:Phage minor structural protein, N-terminal region n=1 Tax=Heliorestis convoluta TaxID=356322 RepID=A0A5Q2N444_9FIRM|nr:phage tail spike protein [Heliorestis convoluta]QGG47355.1 phage minor structural protein, N-terminal region [Heliorestis convoluta]